MDIQKLGKQISGLYAVVVTNPASNFFLDLTKRGYADNSFVSLVYFFINTLLRLVGVVAILFLIIGGYQYITSGANAEMAEQGKKTLLNSVIGLVVVILSYTIITVIYKELKQ